MCYSGNMFRLAIESPSGPYIKIQIQCVIGSQTLTCFVLIYIMISNVTFLLYEYIKFKRYSSSLALTSALDGVGGKGHAPAALPPEKTRYPLYRRLGGPQGRSGRLRKSSPPPGFDPRTVQPVASRYTD